MKQEALVILEDVKRLQSKDSLVFFMIGKVKKTTVVLFLISIIFLSP